MRHFWTHFRKRQLQPETSATPTVVAVLASVALLAAVLLIPQRPVVRFAHAAEVEEIGLTPAIPGKPISLRDRLITGLQARLKSELAFIDTVVALVNTGQLPQRLVDQTFFWARDRAHLLNRGDRKRRPIIYFQPAMVARASRLRVTL